MPIWSGMRKLDYLASGHYAADPKQDPFGQHRVRTGPINVSPTPDFQSRVKTHIDRMGADSLGHARSLAVSEAGATRCAPIITSQHVDAFPMPPYDASGH